MAATADLINDITLELSQGKAFLQKSTKTLLCIEIWVTLGQKIISQIVSNTVIRLTASLIVIH